MNSESGVHHYRRHQPRPVPQPSLPIAATTTACQFLRAPTCPPKHALSSPIKYKRPRHNDGYDHIGHCVGFSPGLDPLAHQVSVESVASPGRPPPAARRPPPTAHSYTPPQTYTVPTPRPQHPTPTLPRHQKAHSSSAKSRAGLKRRRLIIPSSSSRSRTSEAATRAPGEE